MGASFFIIFAPLLFGVIAVITVMAIIGIVVLVVGLSGSVVSAAAISNKRIKTASLLFFSSLLLLGLSCVAVLVDMFSELQLPINPILVIEGAGAVVLGIVGIIKACKIERTVVEVIFIVLLCLSILIGSIVFSIGTYLLITG